MYDCLSVARHLHRHEQCTNKSAATTGVNQQQECNNKTSAATRGKQQEECSKRRSGATCPSAKEWGNLPFCKGVGQLALLQLASSTFPDRQRLRGEEEGREKRREGETWRRGRQEWKREAMWLLSSTCCLPKSGRWRCP